MELFSRSIIYLLQLFISLEGLGHMPFYGQPISSCDWMNEWMNVGQKSLYLDLTRFIISWAPNKQRTNMTLEAPYFLNKLEENMAFLNKNAS